MATTLTDEEIAQIAEQLALTLLPVVKNVFGLDEPEAEAPCPKTDS